MDKGKLVPIVSAIALTIIAIIIVFVNNQRNNVSFEKLIVTYKSQKNEYDSVSVDDVIVVNNVSFWVVSTVKQSVVLNSSENLLVDDKETNEIQIKINKATNVCFSKDDCMIMQLV